MGRRHIGDYPYKCQDCGFVEVCKSGLSSHMRRTGHSLCVKIDGPDRILKTQTPTQKSSHLPNKDEFASERIKDRKVNKDTDVISGSFPASKNTEHRLTAAL